jgi:hypothetical protein
MPARSIGYVLTALVGLAFLGSLLWSTTMLDGLGFLLGLTSAIVFLVSAIASVVLLLFQRSRLSLHLFLINVLVCLLFVPTTKLGTYLKDRLFLRHLARFQEATNILIERGRLNLKSEVTHMGAQLPDDYSDLNVARPVLLDCIDDNVTVRYITRDSSALGHNGYMYRSDDDPVTLQKEFPHLGYKRLAPHWFFFVY